jgi:hypothetical protein
MMRESCGNAVEIELADLGVGYFESTPSHLIVSSR